LELGRRQWDDNDDVEEKNGTEESVKKMKKDREDPTNPVVGFKYRIVSWIWKVNKTSVWDCCSDNADKKKRLHE
jgi:hypothetical protein